MNIAPVQGKSRPVPPGVFKLNHNSNRNGEGSIDMNQWEKFEEERGTEILMRGIGSLSLEQLPVTFLAERRINGLTKRYEKLIEKLDHIASGDPGTMWNRFDGEDLNRTRLFYFQQRMGFITTLPSKVIDFLFDERINVNGDGRRYRSEPDRDNLERVMGEFAALAEAIRLHGVYTSDGLDSPTPEQVEEVKRGLIEGWEPPPPPIDLAHLA